MGRKSWKPVRAMVATALVGTGLVVSNPGGATSGAETPAPEANAQIALAQQLLAVANDESKPPTDRALDTARAALSARRGVVKPELLPLLDQESRNLDTAEQLLEVSSDENADPLALGIDIAKIATDWQAATLGLDLSAVQIDTPAHGSPSEAALALVEKKDVGPTEAQLADLHALDALAEPQRSALTGVIDAFIAFDAATELAYAGADMDRLKALAAEMEVGTLDPASLDITGPGSLLADLGVDVTPILAARNALLDAVATLSDAFSDWGRSPQTMSVCNPTQVAPVISIDLCLEDSSYSQDFLLLIDIFGNDTYLNNAGGASASAAALVDLFGNDHYVSGRNFGINGGGNFGGAGFLLDTLGNDFYTAGGSGTNGGGGVGIGFLLDSSGEDEYAAANAGTNGGGDGGHGMLIDPFGSDPFTATDSATNGGGRLTGTGFLFGGAVLDGVSPDTYWAGNEGTNGGGFWAGTGFLFDAGLSGDTYSAGGSGTNGGGGGLTTIPLPGLPTTGGSGFVMDAGGNDVYGAGSKGVNGGGEAGAGMVLDNNGTDQFTAGSNGANGGGNLGLGFLINVESDTNTAGNDRYTAVDFGTNGGGDVGTGLLLDNRGPDSYQAGNVGTNGGAALGTGVLIDGGGNDSYTAGSPDTNGEAFGGIGLLFDAGGTDTYSDTQVPASSGSGTDRTVIPRGGFGAQIDYPPPPLNTTTIPTLPTTTLPIPTTLPTVTTSTIPQGVTVTGETDLEGNNLTFTITAPGAAALNPASISGTFSTSAPTLVGATPGTDYTAVTGAPVTLNAANNFTQTVNVTVIEDTDVEPPEGILGTFTASSGSVVDDAATGMSVILDDDTPSTTSSSTSSTSSTSTTTSTLPDLFTGYASNDCDVEPNQTVGNFQSGTAYAKLRTKTVGSETWVCFALDGGTGTAHIGGKAIVDATNVPIDDDQTACHDGGVPPSPQHFEGTFGPNDTPVHLDAIVVDDAPGIPSKQLWLCVKVDTVEKRLIIPGGIVRFVPDDLDHVDPPTTTTSSTTSTTTSSTTTTTAPPPPLGEPSRYCRDNGGDEVLNEPVGSGRVWVYTHESGSATSACVRYQTGSGEVVGGRLVVDSDGDQSYVEDEERLDFTTDPAYAPNGPCDVNVVNITSDPELIVKFRNPTHGSPAFLCVRADETYRRIKITAPADQSFVTWDADSDSLVPDDNT